MFLFLSAKANKLEQGQVFSSQLGKDKVTCAFICIVNKAGLGAQF